MTELQQAGAVSGTARRPPLPLWRKVAGAMLIAAAGAALALLFGLDADVWIGKLAPAVLVLALAAPVLLLLGLIALRKRYGVLMLLAAVLLAGLMGAGAHYRIRKLTGTYSLSGLSFVLIEPNPAEQVAVRTAMNKAEVIRVLGPCFLEMGFEGDLCIDRIDVKSDPELGYDIDWCYFKARHPRSDLPFEVAIAYWRLKVRMLELEADKARFRYSPQSVTFRGGGGKKYPCTEEGALEEFEDKLCLLELDPEPFLSGLAQRDPDEALRAAIAHYQAAERKSE